MSDGVRTHRSRLGRSGDGFLHTGSDGQPTRRSFVPGRLGFDAPRDVQTQLAELQSQGLAGDPQQPCRPVLIAVGVLEHLGQELPVDLSVRSP